MKTKLFLITLLSGLYLFSSCDDPKKAKKYTQEARVDQSSLNFIKGALEAGRTEVKLANVAERNSQNPRVIAFAKMMVTDHTKADQALKELRKEKMINPNDELKPEHKELIDSLSKLTGNEFDKAYMAQMVTDHEGAVALFKDETDEREAAVQDFAKKTLPVIEKHLDSAKEIDASFK
jgi:putative membrane protein